MLDENAMIESLISLIEECERCGCVDYSHSLGIQDMPQGYALILNADKSHFFWVCYDGVESVIHWDKWAIYRSAKRRASKKEMQ